jgi:hypothetical protein
MTADREQTRRIVNAMLDPQDFEHLALDTLHVRLARDLRSALDDLDQAEWLVNHRHEVIETLNTRLAQAETLANSLRALITDPGVPEGTWKDAGRSALKDWDEIWTTTENKSDAEETSK